MAKATYVCIRADARSGDRAIVVEHEDEGEAISDIRKRAVAASGLSEVEYMLIRLPDKVPGHAELMTRIKITCPVRRMNRSEAEAYGDSQVRGN